MAREEKIKCLVFDLDNTVWKGVLSEGGGWELIPGIKDFIFELDRRGIIMSIASKNDEKAALDRLRYFGLEEYFLCPQISWLPKSQSIEKIIKILNIKAGSIAFIDDNIFERDEVEFWNSDIRTYDAPDFTSLTQLPEFTPRFITEDAKNRRNMYRADIKRCDDELNFGGSSEEFLKTLDMRLTLSRVTEDDLKRVEELTIRTHQLNSTGYTYSYEELRELISSENHIFMIASLCDKYGESGKVGIILLEKQGAGYVIKLLIVSCRVMSRGIGTAMLIYAIRLALKEGKKLSAEFFETEHNRIMYITYKLMGFEEASDNGGQLLLEYIEKEPPEYPKHLWVNAL